MPSSSPSRPRRPRWPATALPYLEHVARCFAYRARRAETTPSSTPPPRASTACSRATARSTCASRRGTRGLEIAVDRLPAVIDWLTDRFRRRAAALFGLPDGEDLRVSLVTGQPWSGYNWYDGGRRSRVEINTDLPVRGPDARRDTVAHETYPGHHLEHAWKEADLVDAQARLEASILLINTPECLISEGLADLGASFAVPDDEAVDLLVETVRARRAGDRRRSGRGPRARGARRRARGPACRRSPPSAGTPRSCATPTAGRTTRSSTTSGRSAATRRPTAAKRLEFIEHPLWRTYVFVYAEGEALLRRWVEAVPAADRPARFGRLLHEQLTPPGTPPEAVTAPS